jgi:Fe-S-cluster containining protein
MGAEASNKLMEATSFQDGSRGCVRPVGEGRIRFSCHPQIACFTACCADLHLVLTPYDVLRMKKRLGVTAGEFIERYTEPHESGNHGPPLIRLKMREDGGHRCPFVSPKGCAIYEDRPGACRLYPLGRGASVGLSGKEEEFYFIVGESHCLGFQEGREWTADEWIEDQGVRLYNEMNRPWIEVIANRNVRISGLTDQKLAKFHMASYNMDRFREFVFRTKFFKVFQLAPEEGEKVAADEVELMKLAMRWLGFALCGLNTLVLDYPSGG